MSANQGTSSAKVHCPNCQKPLLGQVAMAEGTRFVVRCASCQRFVKIIATFNNIQKRLMSEVRETVMVTSEVSA